MKNKFINIRQDTSYIKICKSNFAEIVIAHIYDISEYYKTARSFFDNCQLTFGDNKKSVELVDYDDDTKYITISYNKVIISKHKFRKDSLNYIKQLEKQMREDIQTFFTENEGKYISNKYNDFNIVDDIPLTGDKVRIRKLSSRTIDVNDILSLCKELNIKDVDIRSKSDNIFSFVVNSPLAYKYVAIDVEFNGRFNICSNEYNDYSGDIVKNILSKLNYRLDENNVIETIIEKSVRLTKSDLEYGLVNA